MFKQGEEVQVKNFGLWEIGAFIAVLPNGKFSVKVGGKSIEVDTWNVKANPPAFQKPAVKVYKKDERKKRTI